MIDKVGFPIEWAYKAYWYSVAVAYHHLHASEWSTPGSFTHEFWTRVITDSKNSVIGGEPFESGFDSNGDPIPVFYSTHGTPVPLKLQVKKLKSKPKPKSNKLSSFTQVNSSVENNIDINLSDLNISTSSPYIVKLPSSQPVAPNFITNDDSGWTGSVTPRASDGSKGAGEINAESTAMLTDTDTSMTDNTTEVRDSEGTTMESWGDHGIPTSGEDASD